MKIKAVITDMDGLLIDSEHTGWLAWDQALKEVGFLLTYEEFLTTVGKGRREFVKWLTARFGEDFPAARATQLRVEIGDTLMATSGMPRKPGVEELFAAISELGIPFGLATSTYREEAEKRLKAADISKSLFHATVCGDEVPNTKPAPDVYLEAARQLGISPAEIIALEDSGTGTRAAIAAGMKVIVVPDLLPLPVELEDKVLATVDSLADAVGILRERCVL